MLGKLSGGMDLNEKYKKDKFSREAEELKVLNEIER